MQPDGDHGRSISVAVLNVCVMGCTGAWVVALMRLLATDLMGFVDTHRPEGDFMLRQGPRQTDRARRQTRYRTDGIGYRRAPLSAGRRGPTTEEKHKQRATNAGDKRHANRASYTQCNAQ